MTTLTVPKVKAKSLHGNVIYLLLKTGQLIGPFASKEAADYWAISLDLPAHSTYDPIRPERFQGPK